MNLSIYDQLLFAVCTVAMEAEGEPYAGKLAVAYSIFNRARNRGQSVPDTVFQAWQYSAWNTDSPTRHRLDDIDPGIWATCWNAVAAVYFNLAADPTGGAEHYLNEELTRKMRGGNLPSWWDKLDSKSEVKIGKHTFRKSMAHTS